MQEISGVAYSEGQVEAFRFGVPWADVSLKAKPCPHFSAERCGPVGRGLKGGRYCPIPPDWQGDGITWGGVEFLPDGIGRLMVRSSKTDQTGEGTVLYLGPVVVNSLGHISPPEAKDENKVLGLSARRLSRRIFAAARAAGISGDFTSITTTVYLERPLLRRSCI